MTSELTNRKKPTLVDLEALGELSGATMLECLAVAIAARLGFY